MMSDLTLWILLCRATHLTHLYSHMQHLILIELKHDDDDDDVQ